MQITRNKLRTPTGPSEWFTGAVYVDAVASPAGEPGEEHWHGATPTRFMTHIAMLEVDDKGNSATWDDHFSDADYAAAPSIEGRVGVETRR